MKFFTIAALFGIVSADAIHDAINAIKIEVSKKGQKRIEREVQDVRVTWKQIENSKPVNRLEHALKKWAHSKEVNNIKQIDKAFSKTKLGKRMIKEWTDVGQVLEENLQVTKRGIHIPNDKLDELEKEIEDVADTYDTFYNGKYAQKWEDAYNKGWKAALSNEESKGVKRRFRGFKRSIQGKALENELKELKQAVKRNVKVTDIPEDWKNQAELLTIEIDEKGQQAIEKEFNDVRETAKKIRHSKPVRRVKHNLRKFAHTPEMQKMREMDKQYLKTPQGQKLMKEWKEFGQSLKEHIQKTENGIHIDNEGYEIIEQEAQDVGEELEEFKNSKWNKKYDRAWKKALKTKEAHRLERSIDRFSKTPQWKKLEKELQDLDTALKENVKVTDVPDDWEEQVDMLKIEVTDDGMKEIEEDLDDVFETVDKIEDSEPVQNVEDRFEELGQTDEAKALGQLEKDFEASPEGQELNKEINEFFSALDEHIKETENGFHIDNEALEIIGDEADDIDEQFKKLEQTHWAQDYETAFDNLGNTQEAHEVAQSIEEFEKSPEGKQLMADLEDLDETIKRNVKVSDIPEDWKEQNLFLF